MEARIQILEVSLKANYEGGQATYLGSDTAGDMTDNHFQTKPLSRMLGDLLLCTLPLWG